MKCVHFIFFFAILFICTWSQAQDTLNQVPNQINEQIYLRIKEAGYPDIPKSKVKSGTCILVIQWVGSWKYSFLNSLGSDFDHVILTGFERAKKEINYQGNEFLVLVPITFVAYGFKYVRSEHPPELAKEIKISGFRSHKSKFSLDRLIRDYRQEYRNGNYSKALKYLDNIILLNPYKAKYRTDRMKLLELLGDKQAGCEDYIFLKQIIRYPSTPASPCISESG